MHTSNDVHVQGKPYLAKLVTFNNNSNSNPIINQILKINKCFCPNDTALHTLHTEIGKKYANLAKQDPGRARQNR